MLKSLKPIFMMVASVVLTIISIFNVCADTIYVVGSYSYTIVDNQSIALCGYDSSFTSLSVPDSLAGRYVTNISSYALADNTTIQTVDFSNASHLKTIGIEAFMGCTALTEINIPSGVTTVRERAFEDCTSLSSVTIDANLTKISEECFYGCSSLQSVVIPDTVTKIEKFAFANCSALEYVEIPASVTSIPLSAFRNDNNLTIGCYKNSFAEQFCINNNLNYTLIYQQGDVNLDGVININDATLLQRYIAMIVDIDQTQLSVADVFADGRVDINDATKIQRIVAKIE